MALDDLWGRDAGRIDGTAPRGRGRGTSGSQIAEAALARRFDGRSSASTAEVAFAWGRIVSSQRAGPRRAAGRRARLEPQAAVVAVPIADRSHPQARGPARPLRPRRPPPRRRAQRGAGRGGDRLRRPVPPASRRHGVRRCDADRRRDGAMARRRRRRVGRPGERPLTSKSRGGQHRSGALAIVLTLLRFRPTVGGHIECPRQDSNLRTRLRRPMLYPLSYEGGGRRRTEASGGVARRRVPVGRSREAAHDHDGRPRHNGRHRWPIRCPPRRPAAAGVRRRRRRARGRPRGAAVRPRRRPGQRRAWRWPRRSAATRARSPRRWSPPPTSPAWPTVEIAGPGFLNLTIARLLAGLVAEIAADDELGIAQADAPERVVVDYSAPNVAKEMHIGHLRTTVIGDALVRMLDAVGHDVVRENHIGDWGRPFGMLIEHLVDVGGAERAESLELGDLDAFYKAANAQVRRRRRLPGPRPSSGRAAAAARPRDDRACGGPRRPERAALERRVRASSACCSPTTTSRGRAATRS